MLQETEVMEPSSIANGRANVYRLLSALYLKEVSRELLKTLKSEEVSEMLFDLGIDISKTLPDILEERLLDELASEYAALFIVPGGIPPYESVRLHGKLCQGPEWQVRNFYERCGLKIKDDSGVFSDHLGMELALMALLADFESRAWKDCDQKKALELIDLQRQFFVEHLDKWAFGFLEDMQKYALHPFYIEVSKLTRNYLGIEREELLPPSSEKVSMTLETSQSM